MNGQRLCFSFARRALPAQHRFLNDTFTHIGMQLFLLASISANTEGVEVEGEARPFGAKKKKNVPSTIVTVRCVWKLCACLCS